MLEADLNDSNVLNDLNDDDPDAFSLYEDTIQFD